MTRSPWENPAGLYTDVPVLSNDAISIGSASSELLNIFVKNLYSSNIVGASTLPNNTFLEGANAAGTGFNGLIKTDASNNTVVNAITGKVITLAVNGTGVGTQSSTALAEPIYNLTDGADKNHSVSSFASGTAYNLTATPAQLVFGTSNAQIVLDKAGTYLLLGTVNYEYSGATFAANRTVTTTLRRTNNTAADVTGSPTAVGTNVVTTVSGIMARMVLPPVVYTTANTNDIITIFGSVSVVPTAGNLQASEANIVAFRLYT